MYSTGHVRTVAKGRSLASSRNLSLRASSRYARNNATHPNLSRTVHVDEQWWDRTQSRTRPSRLARRAGSTPTSASPA
eukprot:534235-Prymnesium_polylepis.1